MFFKYTKWSILWALVILILCGIPGRDIPHISFLELLSFDKFVHASIFFILILLTIWGFIKQTRYTKLQQRAKPIALIICIVYGGSLEIMQGTLFIERSADLFDFMANSIGCIAGLLCYKKISSSLME